MSKEMNNMTVKVFALIIAIILWSYVMSEENPTITKDINVAVEMNNLSSLEKRGLMVIEPKSPMMTVKISGKRNVINKISDGDILATVDLEGYDEGTVRVPIDVETPSNVRVVDKTPRELSFKFEKIINKEIVVEVETTGELPKGYSLGDEKIVPQSLYVEGARSWIESLNRAVVRIDLTNRTEDISLNAPIQLLDKNGDIIRELDKDRNTVDVFIPIYQTKQVPIELVFADNTDKDLEMKLGLKPNSVEITGNRETLDKISKIKSNPINAKEIYSGMTVSLDIPEGVYLVTKDEIKLILDPQTEENIEGANKDKETRTYRYHVKDINFIGLEPGLKLDQESLSTLVELTIEGDPTTINQLEASDLDIQIDFTDLNEGEHTVTPLVPARPGVTLARIIPENLKIRLIREE